MSRTSGLTLAKRRKKDEFYTQLVDIENELRHYKAHFEGKTVLCNCDDPRSSNFLATATSAAPNASNCLKRKSGIYEFLLTGRLLFEKLNLRAFDPDDMRTAYESQRGVCPLCKGRFAFEEMRGDHIRPWSKGGRTVPENLQMLCAECNARKSDKF